MPLNPNAGGFDPNAGAFVPGQGFAPAAETAPAPPAEAAPAPAAEAKEESWESAPNVEAAPEPAAAGDAQEEMEKLDVNDEQLKKELDAMKAEGLIDEEEIEEIKSGTVSVCVVPETCSF